MKKKYAYLTLFLLIVLISCNSTDQKFVGAWKFYEIIPNNKPDDYSMNSTIINIKKYPNTDKTYSVDLWGTEVVLSEKDENTLIGQNSSISLKHDNKTGYLTLIISKDYVMVFSKLE